MGNEETIPARPRVAFLLLLAIAISLLAFWMVRGFVLALVLATVLAAFARPTHRRLVQWLGGREGIAATCTVLLALAIVIVPALLLMGVLLDDAVQISNGVGPWIAQQVEDPDGLQQAVEASPTLRKLLPYQDEIVEKAGELAGRSASFVARAVVGSATGAAHFLLMLFVALYAMFHALKDGGAILDWVFGRLPLTAADRERLVSTFSSVARATLKGKLVIGVVQGGLAGAAFAVAGIEGAVFWAAIMAVLSVLPGIGAALVWVPAVIFLALTGREGAAVGVLLWCALVVATVDNILGPMLIGQDTKMPDLMVLLTTLGGLALFGAAGIIIGPIVGALFLTVWALWGGAVREAGPAGRVTEGEQTA